MTDGVAIAAFIISLATFLFNAMWAPFAKSRAESVKLALEFKREYEEKYREHLTVLYKYREDKGKNAYHTEWLEAMQGNELNKIKALEVDNARRRLGLFWGMVEENYEAGALPRGQSWFTRLFSWIPALWVPTDMMSGNFVRRASSFRDLVEPLDCANWYYLGIDTKQPAPKGDYTADHKSRPNWYTFIDKQTGKGTDDRQSSKSSDELLKDYKDILSRIAKDCKETRDNVQNSSSNV